MKWDLWRVWNTSIMGAISGFLVGLGAGALDLITLRINTPALAGSCILLMGSEITLSIAHWTETIDTGGQFLAEARGHTNALGEVGTWLPNTKLISALIGLFKFESIGEHKSRLALGGANTFEIKLDFFNFSNRFYLRVKIRDET